jgi:hypothetical protein
MSHTTTAAIGILDIIDSLEPAAERAVEEKENALDAALTMALQADPATTLRCLALIDTRLHRPSFRVPGGELQPKLQSKVERMIASNPHALMATCGQYTPAEDSWFWQGMAAGMQTAADAYRACWSDSVAQAWASCLRRAGELSDDVSLRLHVQATAFCLHNPRLPLGPVMTQGFPLFYLAVAMGNANSITDEMFGYFDWAKAKKLRKEVIDAYVASCWPAEELAIVAVRCQILRKVIHRLQRNGAETTTSAECWMGFRSARQRKLNPFGLRFRP